MIGGGPGAPLRRAAPVFGVVVLRAAHPARPPPPPPALAQPGLGGVHEGARGLGIVLALEEAEQPPGIVLELVEVAVDVRRDAPDHVPVAQRQEELDLGVLEERVLGRVDVLLALEAQRWDPPLLGRVESIRQVEELLAVALALDATDLHGHGGAPYMPTRIDVFAKTREHDRSEILRAAREQDLVPYFRLIESPAMPVVEMEGAERVMLGSNNYLGLTADERVKQGAMDALTRYGTGLTGSRLLNGTTPLHLDLEREIAEWMGSEDAIVFTTGHQANVGTLGTILGPGDTVIADSGDHASILDGCLLSRAKLRPFRHGRLDLLEKQLRRAEEDGGGVLVVVDGVFSMEGDIAPLQDICDLCAAHGARLMVDEAHGAGVLGARGAGTAELLGVEDRVDLRMGTFSKSLASCGGFVAGPADVIEYLRIQ